MCVCVCVCVCMYVCGCTAVRKAVTINTLKAKRERGEKISMVTAYDCPSARLCDEAGTR